MKVNFKVNMYDSDGSEVVEPLCSKCGDIMSPIIGKTSFTWICLGKCQIVPTTVAELRCNLSEEYGR